MTSAQPPPPAPRNFLRIAGLSVAVLLALALGAGAALLFGLRSCRSAIADFSPVKIKAGDTWNVFVSSSVVWMNKEAKLVVLQTGLDIQETVHVTSNCEVSALGLRFDACQFAGATDVAMTAHDNRVQFYVPLEGIARGSFARAGEHRARLRLPRPRLDETVVEVQSDSSRYEFVTHNGVLKLDAWSGAPIRREMRDRLRPLVISSAKANAALQATAEANAREKIRTGLTTLNPQYEIEIEFEPALKP